MHALDGAFHKALNPHFPLLRDVHLADYKVRILDPEAATGAKTRVLIEARARRGALEHHRRLAEHHRGERHGAGRRPGAAAGPAGRRPDSRERRRLTASDVGKRWRRCAFVN